MKSRGLAITLATAWLLAAPAGRSEPLPDSDRVMELVYVETNIDASAGGHLALRSSHQVYHYQAVGSRLLLVREPWQHFQDFYQQLENRGLRLARLDLGPGQQRTIESHFNRQLVVQQQHLRREQLLLLERDWYALASGEGGELDLAGLGYFLPLQRAAIAQQAGGRDLSAQLGMVGHALAKLEPASIVQSGDVSRGSMSGAPTATLEQRESLLQLRAALSLMHDGTGLNPENLVYLEQAPLSHPERLLLERYQTELEADIERLLEQDPVAQRMRELKTEYMIWIDGVTVRSDSAGSMTCGIGPGGAGCFGFGTWSNDSDYEAVIWDFTDRAEVGRVTTTATGQSYMPAVVVPIPIIAPVQGTACDGIGDQLLEFLSSEY